MRKHSFFVVVILTFAGAGVGCIIWLYEAKLSPYLTEQTWLSSQRTPGGTSALVLDDSTRVTLRRTSCLGPCPDYRVVIYGSGRVEFHGNMYVCALDPPSYQVDPSQVSRLVSGMLAVDFGEMRSYVHYGWTDAPSAGMRLVHAGREHTVRHYYGDRSAPRLLEMMEDRIDAVANTSRWLPDDSASFAGTCLMSDGTRVPSKARDLTVPNNALERERGQ